MFHAGSRSKALGRRAATVVLVVLCSAASAAAASAASLHVTVPSSVKKGKNYTIALNGTFNKSQVGTRGAFLVSVIQFSPKPCLGSVQAESKNRRPIQLYFAPGNDPARGAIGIFRKTSPFSNRRGFTAGTVGRRRVCAYLYPKLIATPDDATAPIAKAQASYKVTAN